MGKRLRYVWAVGYRESWAVNHARKQGEFRRQGPPAWSKRHHHPMSVNRQVTSNTSIMVLVLNGQLDPYRDKIPSKQNAYVSGSVFPLSLHRNNY